MIAFSPHVHYDDNEYDYDDNNIISNIKNQSDFLNGASILSNKIITSTHDNIILASNDHDSSRNNISTTITTTIKNHHNNSSIISTLGGNQSNSNSDTSSLLHTISTHQEDIYIVDYDNKVVVDDPHVANDHDNNGHHIPSSSALRDKVHGIIKTWSNQRINALLVIVCGQIETKSSLVSKKDDGNMTLYYVSYQQSY